MNNLTDAKIAASKPKKYRYAFFDGNNLWLFVNKSGKKSWTLIYTENETKKNKMLKIGDYPILSLKDARELAIIEMRKILFSQQIRIDSEIPTLEGAFNIWFNVWRHNKAPKTERFIEALFKNHLLPYLGNKIVLDVTENDINKCLSNLIIEKKFSTAKNLLISVKSIYKFKPIRLLLNNYSPVGHLKISDEIPSYKVKNRAKLPINQFSEFIRKIDKIENEIVMIAWQLMALFWTRSKELLFAQWNEFDFDEKLWTIPESRMKKRREHIVPLCDQALKILEYLKENYQFKGNYLFSDNGSIDPDILLKAVWKMGYKGKMTTHGIRGISSSWLNGKLEDERAIKMQLSHLEENKSTLAYNSSQYLDIRRGMMQRWADFIDSLRK